jgi:hypothetical protein
MSNSNYVMPLPVLLRRSGLPEQLEDGVIEVSREQIYDLIRNLLASVNIDEEWYLNTYHDIAQAVKEGALPSAKHHFITSGYFEGRKPGKVKVDEAFYAAKYPDIAEAVEYGEIGSAQEHFDSNGLAEGRLPYDIER